LKAEGAQSVYIKKKSRADFVGDNERIWAYIYHCYLKVYYPVTDSGTYTYHTFQATGLHNIFREIHLILRRAKVHPKTVHEDPEE
jgi:hypothetical protein